MPCNPCGNLLSKVQACRCSEREVKRYQNKLSDPFLDRIDLFVVMQEVENTDVSDVTSEAMHEAVIKTFVMQKRRGQKRLNGKLNEDEIETYCALSEDAQKILSSAITKFGLSHRSIASLKKIGRTMADLNGNEKIDKK